MKKIMCAFAIASMAIVANAASVSWSGLAGPLATAGDSAASYSVYLINAATFSSADDAVASIMGGNSSGILATTSGIAAGTAFRFGVTAGDLAGTWNAGDAISAYALVLDGSTATAENFLATATKEATVSAAGLANFSYGSMAALQWQAVPEPTSGLLMLVGLAGLALRRRRT